MLVRIKTRVLCYLIVLMTPVASASQECELLTKLPQSYADNFLLDVLKDKKFNNVFLLDNQSVYKCGECIEVARLGGAGDDARLGGAGDGTRLGGAGDGTRLGGAGDDARLGGAGDGTRLGGAGDDARLGGAGDGTRLGGAGDDARLGGSGDGTRLGGAGDDTRIGGHSYALSCKVNNSGEFEITNPRKSDIKFFDGYTFIKY